MLSRVRDRTRAVRAEIILVDRPSLFNLCREIPQDVLLVRTEHPVPLPRLLYAGLLASRARTIVWCPHADLIPAVNLADSTVLIGRQHCVVSGTPQLRHRTVSRHRADRLVSSRIAVPEPDAPPLSRVVRVATGNGSIRRKAIVYLGRSSRVYRRPPVDDEATRVR